MAKVFEGALANFLNLLSSPLRLFGCGDALFFPIVAFYFYHRGAISHMSSIVKELFLSGLFHAFS